MRLIKNWNQFNLIQELDATGTYLDQKNFKKTHTSLETSITRKKYGKVFAQAPKTADKSWGLKFEENGTKYGGTLWKVIFPDDFMKYFDDKFKINRPDTTTNQKISAPSKESGSETTSKINNFDGFRRPISIERPDVSGLKSPVSGARIKWEDLQDINIVAVKDSSNRTHFLPGVPDQFKGIGLGYVVYEEFIKFLGFASSDNTAKPEAQKIWSQIIQDPDFYGMVVKRNPQNFGAVFVVHKNCNKPEVEKEIIDWVKKSIFRDDYNGIVIDDNIFKKYPNLQKYKEQWTVETKTKLNSIHKSLEDIFKNEDLEQLDGVIKFASDNSFEIVDWNYQGDPSKEKQVVKDGLIDLGQNPSRLNFYKKVFEKLLSSKILGFEILRKLFKDTVDDLKPSLRDDLISYLYNNLQMKDQFKKIHEYVTDAKLKKDIASYKIEETQDASFRFKYFYENQDSDLESFIKWCNNHTFEKDELVEILKFLYVVKDKQKAIDKLDKSLFEQFLTIFEYYGFRYDELLLVDNLDNHGEQTLHMKKDFTIENSYKFYTVMIKYIKGKDFKEAVEKFLISQKEKIK